MYRRILECATSEFAAKGYAGARMDEIARKARINKATIYYHIGGKAALYSEVLDSTFGSLAGVMADHINFDNPPSENLRLYIRTLTTSIRENSRIPPIMLRESAGGGKHLPAGVVASLSSIFEILARIIQQGIDQNEFHPASSFVVHFMVISPLVFLKQMEKLIKRQIKKLGPENIISTWPENIGEEIEALVFRALSVK